MSALDPASRVAPVHTPQADARAEQPTQAAVAPLPTGAYRPEPGYHPQMGALAFAPAAPNGGAAAATFADGVRGQQSQAIDLDLMKLANAAYDPSVTSIGGWTRVSDADLRAAGIDPATMHTPGTGFSASVYGDGNGHYVLAFAGSNETQDWTGANFPQGLGFDAEQYDQAVALAQDVVNSPFGDHGNLAITGHSLGGGLAATASLATGVPAVTFDASGVHDKTLERLGLDPGAAKAEAENGLIRRYHVDGDPLTAAQEDTPILSGIMPDAPGHEITLDSPLAPLKKPEWTWNPIEMAKREADYVKQKAERVADLHRQQTMIDALQQQQPWNH